MTKDELAAIRRRSGKYGELARCQKADPNDSYDHSDLYRFVDGVVADVELLADEVSTLLSYRTALEHIRACFEEDQPDWRKMITPQFSAATVLHLMDLVLKDVVAS